MLQAGCVPLYPDLALAENAVQNGVEVQCGTEPTGSAQQAKGIRVVTYGVLFPAVMWLTLPGFDFEV